MNEKAKKKMPFLKGIKYAVFFSIFLFFSVVIFQNIRVQVDSKYIPSLFGHTYLNVLSNSMAPEFKTDDLIISEKINKSSDIKIGDIITFKEGKMLVTHRVVAFDEETNLWTTKGDANNVEDQTAVKLENIVSKYRFSIPKAGLIVAKLQDFTFLALLWLITMYWIISEIVKVTKRIRQEKQESLN